MVFIKYPHEGIAFLFNFEFLIFGGKERFFGTCVTKMCKKCPSPKPQPKMGNMWLPQK
jgi:hypothetical protein